MSAATFVPPEAWYVPGDSPEESARKFHEIMRLRRSVRMFSERPVSKQTIEWLVQTASSAPSGANKQPWRFVCIQDRQLKHRIRIAVEQEESTFYHRRANEEWLEDLAVLGTDEHKAFLEVAPWLIVVFKLSHDDDGSQVYYVNESVGIAVGMFLAAAQHAGLATLVHTPSPMGFLTQLLARPAHERPFALVPVGYPADDLVVPEASLSRKRLDQVMVIDRADNPAAE